MHPSTHAGGLTQPQRARLRSLVFQPGRDCTEAEALTIGLLADYEALARHVRGVVSMLPEGHPLVRELQAFLEAR
jgi:hypothetical protein